MHICTECSRWPSTIQGKEQILCSRKQKKDVILVRGVIARAGLRQKPMIKNAESSRILRPCYVRSVCRFVLQHSIQKN